MTVIDLAQAQRSLPDLLDRVDRGEEVAISEGGQVRAKIVAVPKAPRVPGRLKGRIRISDDFDDPLPEDVLALFEATGK